jgi:hypothetical protein
MMLDSYLLALLDAGPSLPVPSTSAIGMLLPRILAAGVPGYCNRPSLLQNSRGKDARRQDSHPPGACFATGQEDPCSGLRDF